MKNYITKQIGIVKSSRKKVCLFNQNNDLKLDIDLALKQYGEMTVSEIIIYKEYEECLNGIKDFSHLIITFWTHFVSEKARQIKEVHPGGIKECPIKGIFATRSPVRPNPICQMTVKLLERKDNILIVEDLDAVDGTPIIDIKPHLPFLDSPFDVKIADWVNKLMDYLLEKAESSGYTHYRSHLHNIRAHPCLYTSSNSDFHS
jgi:tRNA-Thr(GGU) m(6)t(6)A37 methyltransferase TsaA